MNIFQNLSFLLLFSGTLSAQLDFDLKASGAIIMNAETGVILFEKNAHVLHYPASITKIATAAYALKEQGHKLDTVLTAEHHHIAWVKEEAKARSNYTIPSFYLVPGASHMGILKGEEMILRDLLYGMMVASADDASNVIAQFIGGTIPNFMTDMNTYLKELGCHNTYFMNPHGLHHPKHQTTAYDMAILTREAMQNPHFRDMVGTVKYKRPKTNKQNESTLFQTNLLLRNGKHKYSKAVGVKTGYTSKAQYNLVAAAEDGERTLLIVLLKCPNRETAFQMSREMFEKAFEESKVTKNLVQPGPQKPVLSLANSSATLKTFTKNIAKVSYYPSEEPKLKLMVYWDDLDLPVSKGERVGEFQVQRDDGYVFQKVPLYAQNDVKKRLYSRVRDSFDFTLILKVLLSGAAVLLIGGLAWQLRRK